jgi:hypothetical protein
MKPFDPSLAKTRPEALTLDGAAGRGAPMPKSVLVLLVLMVGVSCVSIGVLLWISAVRAVAVCT